MDTEFAEFVSARYEPMLRYAYLLTSNRASAEDLLQDALAGLLRASRRGLVDNPDSYVRRSLTNGAVSTWRRKRLRSVPLDELTNEPAASEGTALDERDHLWTLITTLPPRQRAVLVLRYYEDLDENAICDVLNIAPGTVRSQLHKARESLRRSITALEGHRA